MIELRGYKEKQFMRFQITIEVWKKGKWFIAKTPELEMIGFEKLEVSPI